MKRQILTIYAQISSKLHEYEVEELMKWIRCYFLWTSPTHLLISLCGAHFSKSQRADTASGDGSGHPAPSSHPNWALSEAQISLGAQCPPQEGKAWGQTDAKLLGSRYLKTCP